MPGVRIYPFKEVESGAQIHENLIWESRASSPPVRPRGVSGRVNVDLTPEVALRLAMALGTALKRGDRVVASRARCRLPADPAGGDRRTDLHGVHAADLRVLPAAVNRHLLKTEGYDAGSTSAEHDRPRGRADPVLRAAGDPATPGFQKEIEKRFPRGVAPRRLGRGRLVTFPGRVRESYATTC